MLEPDCLFDTSSFSQSHFFAAVVEKDRRGTSASVRHGELIKKSHKQQIVRSGR